MNRVTNHSLSPLIFHIPPNFVRIKQRGVTSFPADAFQIHARGRGRRGVKSGSGLWKKEERKKIYIYSRSELTVHRIQQNCRHRSSMQTCARIHPPRPRSGWKINRSNISIREGWILGDFWLDRLDKGRPNQFRIVSPKLIEIESITGGRGGWIERAFLVVVLREEWEGVAYERGGIEHERRDRTMILSRLKRIGVKRVGRGGGRKLLQFIQCRSGMAGGAMAGEELDSIGP